MRDKTSKNKAIRKRTLLPAMSERRIYAIAQEDHACSTGEKGSKLKYNMYFIV